MRNGTLDKAGKKAVSEVVGQSEVMSDVLRHFGLSCKGTGNFNTLKKFCRRNRIDIDHLVCNAVNRRANHLRGISSPTPLSKILVVGSTFNRWHLKNRLINEGLLREKCDQCGIGPEWNGFALSLQLDHVNGVSDDNRIENLRLLCPNCHSQTSNFSGKVNSVP